MSDPGIVARMKDCLERQIVCFEELQHDFRTLEEDLDGATLDDFVSKRDRQQSGTAHLVEEFDVLYREWETTEGISESARQGVRRLAERADLLSVALQEILASGSRIAEEKSTELSQTLASFRQGKQLLRKYRPLAEETADHVDREA